MSGQIQKVTHSECCCICGGPDWCFRIYHDDGSTTHHCYRQQGLSQMDVGGTDGRFYKFKFQKTGDLGTYGIFQEMSEYEAYQAAWHKEHGQGSGHNRKVVYCAPVTQQVVKEVLQPVAPPARLHAVYSYFLSLLVLEDKHLKVLKDEWQKGIEPDLWKRILAIYPLKSIPPEDQVRFNLVNERFKNKTRKKIMELMIDKFGDLTGIPGFFQRKDGRWTFASTAGIAYPQINTRGQIIRLDVADDYPKVIAEDGSGTFIFSYKDSTWYIETKDGECQLVDSQRLGIHKVEMTKRGYPKGKVNGKYKHFSSHKTMKIKDEHGVIREVNRFRNGTGSGACCSIYAKPGDSWHTVYITEGAKKGIVGNMLLGIPVIALPGVGAFAQLGEIEAGYDMSILDFLIMKGCKNLVVAYDSDKKTNIQVLTSEKKITVFLLNKKDFNIYIAEWSNKFGKGLDDISIMGVRPTYYPITI